MGCSPPAPRVRCAWRTNKYAQVQYNNQGNNFIQCSPDQQCRRSEFSRVALFQLQSTLRRYLPQLGRSGMRITNCQSCCYKRPSIFGTLLLPIGYHVKIMPDYNNQTVSPLHGVFKTILKLHTILAATTLRNKPRFSQT